MKNIRFVNARKLEIRVLIGFVFNCFILNGAFATVTGGEAEESSTDQAEIIAGTLATITDYPWIGFMADADEQQYCGASLISPTWALSAAHCFVNEAGDAVDVETGANSTVVLNSLTAFPFAEDAVNAAIARIIVHPSYDPNIETSPNKDDYDIALIELTEAVNLQPVHLPAADSAEVAAGTEVRIMGWGTTEVTAENESINPADELLEARQKIVSESDCSTIYEGGITENMICAGAVDAGGTADTCQGDSGGPMVLANGDSFVQVGIVSFGGTATGPACGDPDAPGVYAKVSAMASFIGEHVSDATFVTLAGDSTSTPEPTEQTSVLSASVDGTTVTISWTEATGAIGYLLYYAPYPDQSPIAALDLASALEISGDLPSGSAFYIAIEPYGETGSLTLSNIEVFMVP